MTLIFEVSAGKKDGVECLSFVIASLTQHYVATGVAPPNCLSVPGCRRELVTREQHETSAFNALH